MQNGPQSGGLGWHCSCPPASYPRLVACLAGALGSLLSPPHPTEMTPPARTPSGEEERARDASARNPPALACKGPEWRQAGSAAKPSPTAFSKAQLSGSQGQASLCPQRASLRFHGGTNSKMGTPTEDLISLLTGGQGALATVTGNFSHGTGRHRPACNEQPPAKPVPVDGGPCPPPSTCLARSFPGVHYTGQESTWTSLFSAVVKQAYHSPAFRSKGPAP